VEIRRLQKSGSSYFIAMPKKYIEALGLKKQDQIIINLKDGKIEVMPISNHIRMQLGG